MSPSQESARLALACLDLTSLNDADTEAEVAALARRAQTRFGVPAALCVWPRLAACARRHAPPGVAVAAVANFPQGEADGAAAVNQARAAVHAGVDEVDVVLPWRALQAGDEAAVTTVLRSVREIARGRVLKVILESGELQDEALVRRASVLALNAGADFLKTSTGKTPRGATPAAARAMLETIAARPGCRAGFKASGGVRTVADAAVYIDLVRQILGPAALDRRRFRIGASGLLDDIEAVLGGQAAPAPGSGY